MRDTESDEQALQIRALEAIVSEFLIDPRVCMAIAKDCVGRHGEDPCQCLYCRAKKTLGEA